MPKSNPVMWIVIAVILILISAIVPSVLTTTGFWTSPELVDFFRSISIVFTVMFWIGIVILIVVLVQIASRIGKG